MVDNPKVSAPTAWHEFDAGIDRRWVFPTAIDQVARELGLEAEELYARMAEAVAASGNIDELRARTAAVLRSVPQAGRRQAL